ECGRVGRRQTFLFGLKTARFKALFFAPFAFFFFEAFWPTARDLPWYPHKATYEFVLYLRKSSSKYSNLI
ncbi:hypothetical protein PRO82_000984, partial [Candidatus Protochlamydia amoebophila]|uniref:hypothetical protein n=1 Tax=Candidatus Protochlamydia amoebophila TaxID=362787 RepID=UPI001BC99B7B